MAGHSGQFTPGGYTVERFNHSMSSDGRYPVAFKECLITPAGREEMDNSWLARLAAKLQATLIVSQRVCMCVGNMLNISETRRHGGFVSNRDPIEKSLRWVDW